MNSSTYSFTVLVNGDTTTEPAESFFVNVTNVTGATVADAQGKGTILDDDVDVCAQPYTPIYAIQGSGPSAAVTGTVATEGVVVGDYEDRVPRCAASTSRTRPATATLRPPTASSSSTTTTTA